MNSNRLLLLLLIFLAFTPRLGLFFAASAAANKEEAASALANAEVSVASAYNATVNAEQAGANITSLLVDLNDAGRKLSKAEVAYKQGDFYSAFDLAGNCSQVAQIVMTEADRLRLEALGSRYMDVWLRMTVSILAVIAVGLSSFGAWRFFRKRYYQPGIADEAGGNFH